ncbi:Xaa-Pro aminopeptidase, partial [Candidatus Gastranaerophilus sp. (ex Termes propinquus)]
LKDCFKRLDKAIEAFKGRLQEGLDEARLKEIVEEEIFAQGARALSFKTILAIGENSSFIHYNGLNDKRKLKAGDTVLLDCGAYFEGGLATDITRVFVLGGASKEQKTVYTRVLQAFLRAYYKSANTGFELDELARDFLKSTAPEGFEFSHSLGHGVGVSVHQAPPVISPADKEKAPLVSGNVFSIEPGLYCEGKFGVRLENVVYISEEGEKISLSKFPFEEALVDFELLDEEEEAWLRKWQVWRE